MNRNPILKAFDPVHDVLAEYMRRAGLLQQAMFERLNVNQLQRTDSGYAGRDSNIPIGSVAYGSLGSELVHVAGTIYVSEIFVPRTRLVTGIGVLNGATVGTHNLIVALFSAKGGMPVMTSALAGTLSAGADAFQEIPFIRPYQLQNDGRHWIGLQASGTTPKTRRIAAATYLNLTKSYTGTFGTFTPLVVPTTFTADVGPIAYIY